MVLKLDRVGMTTPSGKMTLLEDISLRVAAGDRLAIVGASGAGKSLLLRLLARLDDPTSGTLFWRDRPFCEYSVLEWRRQIVLVLQESKLLGMTVAEAIAYPLQLRGVPKAQVQQRVEACCDRLKLPDDWLGKTELELSVGQRQLVAIARAIVAEPPVLLLDEPTSALDVGRSLELVMILRNLAETQGTTILMTNHQLDIARQFASRVLYLEQGRIAGESPAEDTDWDDIQRQIVALRQREAEEWG